MGGTTANHLRHLKITPALPPSPGGMFLESQIQPHLCGLTQHKRAGTRVCRIEASSCEYFLILGTQRSKSVVRRRKWQAKKLRRSASLPNVMARQRVAAKVPVVRPYFTPGLFSSHFFRISPP